ncbi:hypothetical protein OEZ86_006663 [Tetradesmus obliquus]|nr:hypothetical protein OEZ86_006663 [Tetradesmus obliquus]
MAAASLPSVDAPSVAWQNSSWNLAGRDVPAGSSSSKFLQPEGGVMVADQQFIVTFKPSVTNETAKQVDSLFVATGAATIQASDYYGPNAWSGVLFTAPKYPADWAYLLQQLADMPDVVAIEPNFVVSTVFSAEAVAARQQQRQQPAAPVAAAADTPAAVAEEDEAAATGLTAAATAAEVLPVLQPTFAAKPVPAVTAEASLSAAAAPAGMAAAAGEATEQAAAEAAAMDWLPRQGPAAGRRLKAW